MTKKRSREFQLGDQPLEEKYEEQITALVQAIDVYFNEDKKGKDRDVGFVLLVFPYGEGEGKCNFASNGANRQDIIALFKEMIARFEGQPQVSGRA